MQLLILAFDLPQSLNVSKVYTILNLIYSSRKDQYPIIWGLHTALGYNTDCCGMLGPPCTTLWTKNIDLWKRKAFLCTATGMSQEFWVRVQNINVLFVNKRLLLIFIICIFSNKPTRDMKRICTVYIYFILNASLFSQEFRMSTKYCWKLI